MSTLTLQEFLQKERHRAIPDRSAREQRDEWIAAVNRLMEQIKGWLADADPEGILAIVSDVHERAERKYGTYRVHGLTIAFGNEDLTIVPIARDVLGSLELPGQASPLPLTGRVDVTNRIRKYTIFRTALNNTDAWFAIDRDYRPRAFDRACFEWIVQDLLA